MNLSMLFIRLKLIPKVIYFIIISNLIYGFEVICTLLGLRPKIEKIIYRKLR